MRRAYTPIDEMAGGKKGVRGWTAVAARRASAIASLEPAEVAFLGAAVALAPWVRASLARRGLDRTLKSLDRIPRGRGRGRVGASRGATLVRWAFLRSDGTCLPESLVQLALHRWWGPEVELVIGVRRGTTLAMGESGWNLAAHAWVEANDGPPADAAGFDPILRRRLGD